MNELIPLDALGADGLYRTRTRQRVHDVTGGEVAELTLVPRLFVARTMSALRRARSLPADERIAALARTATTFTTAGINGHSLAQYQDIVSRVSGMGISAVRSSTEMIAEAARLARHSVLQGRPVGAAGDLSDPARRDPTAAWTRRGDVFAVHAAGNHPATHALWLEALALGYRVALRPSGREPFTPHRLVGALRASGFGDDQVVLLPTDHETADEILREADLGMVYGGQDVVDKYRNDTHVLPQGPGRSKILITADVDWHEHLDTIVDSVVGQGGTACTNATAVLIEGDPAPLARALSERLAAIPSLSPQDDRALLPVRPVRSARAVEELLLSKAAGTRPWLGGDGVVDELPSGGAVLRPAVHQVDRPDAEQVGVELPFPCVWVAPWSYEAGTSPLRNTLVLNVATRDERLIGDLVSEPTVANVYLGRRPTHWYAPGVPHDGYLSDFLMRTKAVVREARDQERAPHRAGPADGSSQGRSRRSITTHAAE
ncbi:aldehyde dehydrogenase family protein [Streptomyces sp. NPDC089424]|uniref:aldehyde dehydrogenase family protein n=1 Tax=Streptomyces sp. NPDC089424 TaxID=3365917 RepID=UPI0037FCD06F